MCFSSGQCVRLRQRDRHYQSVVLHPGPLPQSYSPCTGAGPFPSLPKPSESLHHGELPACLELYSWHKHGPGEFPTPGFPGTALELLVFIMLEKRYKSHHGKTFWECVVLVGLRLYLYLQCWIGQLLCRKETSFHEDLFERGLCGNRYATTPSIAAKTKQKHDGLFTLNTNWFCFCRENSLLTCHFKSRKFHQLK